MSQLWLLLMRSLEREGAAQTERAGVGLLHPCPLSPGTLTWRTSEKCTILHVGRELPLAPVLAGLSRLPPAASPKQPPPHGLCAPWGFLANESERQPGRSQSCSASAGRGHLGSLTYFLTHVLIDFSVFTVSAVHKETKQFFTLYNTLDDKKVYLEKEVRAFIERR